MINRYRVRRINVGSKVSEKAIAAAEADIETDVSEIVDAMCESAEIEEKDALAKAVKSCILFSKSKGKRPRGSFIFVAYKNPLFENGITDKRRINLTISSELLDYASNNGSSISSYIEELLIADKAKAA